MRILLTTILVLLTWTAAPAQTGGRTGDKDPILGNWQVSAKDTATGTIFHGTLQITKTESGGYQCNMRLQAVKTENLSGKAMQEPYKYDATRRTLTISGGGAFATHNYSAYLAPDGKTLQQGRWKETEKSLQSEQTVETGSSSGFWSAKAAGQ